MPKPSVPKYIAIKTGYTRYADWYLYVTLGMYMSLSLSLAFSLSRFLSRALARALSLCLYYVYIYIYICTRRSVLSFTVCLHPPSNIYVYTFNRASCRQGTHSFSRARAHTHTHSRARMHTHTHSICIRTQTLPQVSVSCAVLHYGRVWSSP